MVFQAYRGNSARKYPNRAVLMFCLSVFVIPFSLSAAEDDDYLSALNQEAKKVDGKGEVSDTSGSVVTTGNTAVSREAFEAELKEKYAGSAVFYSKLPPGSQEEIFLEYQDGATIVELRKKIMDRFLHR
ncbi:MAG: hypothetical protein OQL27_03715 [Sedimenticola sp.]|nr:hypothetical protein [Sedimenticola sp.]